MSIVSHHELARTFEAELGVPEKAVRRWALVLSDNTLSGAALTESTVISTLGLGTYGTSHPTWSHLGLRRVTITERFGDSPYHVEAVAEYGFLTSDEVLGPTSRATDWVFEATQGQVPALFYYEGSGNGDKRALTNSANDYYEGLVADESMIKITWKRNIWPFPNTQFQMNNFVNSDSFLGCAAGTVKCIGVNADYTREFFGNVTYQYYACEVQFQYRQSGWALQLPDVGWNYIDGGEKRRAMVFDFRNSEWVASANPIALDGNGGIGYGAPPIKTRRVNPETAFTPTFGSPPT